MNTIFSTVDRFTSHFKLVDSLIDTVATRLLPQQKAQAYGCGSGYYHCGDTCRDELCNPNSNYGLYVCCDNVTHQNTYSIDFCGC